MGIENTDLVKKGLVPLAKQYGVSKDKVWMIFEIIQGNLIDTQDTALRSQVNQWWRESKKQEQFPKIGLGILSKVSNPSKLPAPTYIQICCLMLCEETFKEDYFQRMQKTFERKTGEIRTVPKVEFTLWQKISQFFKEILRFFQRKKKQFYS